MKQGFGPGTDPVIATHLVVVVGVGVTVLNISQGFVVSSRIGMKFGRIVLQINAHWFDGVGFSIWRHSFCGRV